MAQSVVVTGVSTGIGRGIADVLVACGITVFGSVRKESDAERLARELGPLFEPLLFDVADEAAIARAAATVRERLGDATLTGLVNNAGLAVPYPLLMQNRADFQRHLDVNLIGPLLTAQAFAPLLGAEPGRSGTPGRIVNITSIGGKLSVPFLGAYVSSKHGLEALSGSLRQELQLYGIDVIVVGPGAVRTAIWDKNEAIDASGLAGTDWEEPYRTFMTGFNAGGRKGFEPGRIGEVVLAALTADRPKTRYAPVFQKFRSFVLPRILPPRMVDRTIGKAVGLSRRRS